MPPSICSGGGGKYDAYYYFLNQNQRLLGESEGPPAAAGARRSGANRRVLHGPGPDRPLVPSGCGDLVVTPDTETPQHGARHPTSMHPAVR